MRKLGPIKQTPGYNPTGRTLEGLFRDSPIEIHLSQNKKGYFKQTVPVNLRKLVNNQKTVAFGEVGLIEGGPTKRILWNQNDYLNIGSVRTNNHLESFHSSFNRSFRSPHSNVFALVIQLKKKQ